MPRPREARFSEKSQDFLSSQTVTARSKERVKIPEKQVVSHTERHEIRNLGNLQERLAGFRYHTGDAVEQYNHETGERESWKVDYASDEGRLALLVKETAGEANFSDYRVLDKAELALLDASMQLAREYERLWDKVAASYIHTEPREKAAKQLQEQLAHNRARILEICGREELYAKAEEDITESDTYRLAILQQAIEETLFTSGHPAHRKAEMVEAKIEEIDALEEFHFGTTTNDVMSRLLRAETRQRILQEAEDRPTDLSSDFSELHTDPQHMDREKTESQEEEAWKRLKTMRQTAERRLLSENDFSSSQLAEAYKELYQAQEEALYSSLLRERMNEGSEWQQTMNKLETRLAPNIVDASRDAALRAIHEKERYRRESERLTSQKRQLAEVASITDPEEDELPKIEETSPLPPQVSLVKTKAPKKRTWGQELKQWLSDLWP